MITVFRVKGQSKLVTGIDGPFDTEEVSEYLSTHRRSAIVGVATLAKAGAARAKAGLPEEVA